MVSLSSPWGRSLDDGALHFYLAPENAVANDRNPGDRPGLPLATLDAAIDALNALRATETPVIVHMSSNGGDPYVWPVNKTLGPLKLGAPVVFISDGADQAGDNGQVELLSGTLDAGTSDLQLTVVGGGLTPNAFQGKTVEITSGDAVGYRRTIGSNDATSLIPVNRVGLTLAPAAGDTFVIFEPGATITIPPSGQGDSTADAEPTGAFISRCGDSGGNPLFSISNSDGRPSVWETNQLYFVGLAFELAEASLCKLQVSRSSVCMLGCEFQGDGSQNVDFQSDMSSLISLGMDTLQSRVRAAMPFQLGLTVDSFSWAGWGLYLENAGLNNLETVSRGVGLFVSDNTVKLFASSWSIYGGEVITDNLDGLIIDQSKVRMVCPVIGLLNVTSTGESASSAAIKLTNGSAVHFSNVVATKSGQGACIQLSTDSVDGVMPSMASIDDNCELLSGSTNADYGIQVFDGGKVNIDGGGLSFFGTFDEDELAVTANATATPTASASGTMAGLASAGEFYPLAAAVGTDLARGQIMRV